MQGVLVSTRFVEGAPLPEIRAEKTIPSRPADAFQAVLDFDNLVGYFPRLALSKVLEQQRTTMLVHQRIALPGPLSSREFVIEVHWREPTQRGDVYEVRWCLADPDKQPVGSASVVPDAFFGRWQFAAVGANRTQVVHEVYLDPGGSIPNWLLRLSMADDIPALIDAVEAKIAAPREPSAR